MNWTHVLFAILQFCRYFTSDHLRISDFFLWLLFLLSSSSCSGIKEKTVGMSMKTNLKAGCQAQNAWNSPDLNSSSLSRIHLLSLHEAMHLYMRCITFDSSRTCSFMCFLSDMKEDVDALRSTLLTLAFRCVFCCQKRPPNIYQSYYKYAK